MSASARLREVLGAAKYYAANHIVAHLPSYTVRHAFYRAVCRYRIGKGSSIHLNAFVTGRRIVIGDHSTVGRRCYLDGRGELTIGSCVSISPDVHLITAAHDMDDPFFGNTFGSIVIEDYVWIGTRATVLPNTRLRRGCVVAAGAVVSGEVEPFTVVGGVPARMIRKRNADVRYRCDWFYPFD